MNGLNMGINHVQAETWDTHLCPQIIPGDKYGVWPPYKVRIGQNRVDLNREGSRAFVITLIKADLIRQMWIREGDIEHTCALNRTSNILQYLRTVIFVGRSVAVWANMEPRLHKAE